MQSQNWLLVRGQLLGKKWLVNLSKYQFWLYFKVTKTTFLGQSKRVQWCVCCHFVAHLLVFVVIWLARPCFAFVSSGSIFWVIRRGERWQPDSESVGSSPTQPHSTPFENTSTTPTLGQSYWGSMCCPCFSGLKETISVLFNLSLFNEIRTKDSRRGRSKQT